MRAVLFFLIRSAGAGGVTGTAADAAAPVFDGFAARLDGDGDGVISAEEYAAVGEPSAFAEIDTDADGVVSGAELRAWISLTSPRPPTRDPSLPSRTALGVAARTPQLVWGGAPMAAAAPVGSAAAHVGTGIGRLRSGSMHFGERGRWLAIAMLALGMIITGGRLAVRSRRVRRWLS